MQEAAPDIQREMLDRATEAINAVAQKLGQGSDYFWPILVREQFVWAISAIGIWLFFLVASGLIARAGARHIDAHEKQQDEREKAYNEVAKARQAAHSFEHWSCYKREDDDGGMVCAIGGTIVCLLALVVGLFMVPEIAKILFAPEAAALREILTSFK